MKKVLIQVLFLFCAQVTLHAQTGNLNIRDVFKQMPDSLMPNNNRLDMLDFMDAKMKAAVDNMLGGESVMLFLSEDSLCIQLSEAMTMELKLQREDADTIILMRRTYQTLGRQKEELVSKFSSLWRPISNVLVRSSLLKRDEEVLDKSHL